MKVLIPYDGTKEAGNALLELQNAGFGQRDEILIVITDVFLPESAEEFLKAKKERLLNLEKSGTCSYIPARRRMEEEKLLSRKMRRLSNAFPSWNIKIETLPGDSLVSSEILEKAAVWKAELIVLGSQNSKVKASNNGYKSSLWRIVSEAKCEVWLAHGTKRRKSAVKPDDVFIEDKKSSNGKHNSEKQTVLDDIAKTFPRHAKCSIEIVRTTEKSEQIPKLAARRQVKPQREIKNTATAAVAF